LFSFLLSFLLFLFFFSKTSVREVLVYTGQANLFLIVLAFLSHYASYLVRGCRWKRMVEGAGVSGKTLVFSKIILLFQSLNCVLPAKLGDLYGAHLMKMNFSLTRSFSLGSIFLWRIFDLVLVVGFAAGTAFFLFGDRVPREIRMALKVGVPLFMGFLVMTGLFFYLSKRVPFPRKWERFRGIVASFKEGLRVKRGDLLFLLTTTLVIWFLEAGRFYLVSLSLGVSLSLLPILFVTSTSAFLTTIPFTPSGLGAVELSLLKLLEFLNIGNQTAYPLILWDRLIAHWSQILLGLLLLLLSRPLKLKIWESQEEKNRRV
jgi:uncharacterized protein (TIRG00374 family)